MDNPNKTFKLVIRLGNDAMQRHEDIATALRKVADRLVGYGVDFDGVIMDANGNKVGTWAVD